MKKITPKNISCGLLFLLTVVVMGYRLWYPPDPYYDEIHYVGFVKKLIYENIYFGQANQHPPLWHVLMAFCIEIFGDHAFSWRILSFVAHIGVVLLTFLLARKITRDDTVAWLAVFLILFDCLSLTQARIAMMNSLMMLFLLLSVYAFLNTFKDHVPYDHAALRQSGIFWALAFSTKMVSVNLLVFLVPLLIMEFKKRPAERKPMACDFALYFLVFPAFLLCAVFSFVPLLHGRSFADIWGIQAYNMYYHATMHQTHGYSSRWWGWPLLLRPISFYFKGINWNDPGASCETILAIGNPVVFWAIPLATVYVLWEFIRRRSRVHGLVLWGFLSQWLPFALGARLQFFHYFYQAMPFVAMALALLFSKIYSLGKWGKVTVGIYLVLVAGMFVYWYPLLTGMVISRVYFYQHMWFRSWI